jgi:hypothetical protein
VPKTEIYIKLVVGFPRDQKVRALARYGTDAGLARDLYVQMILHCKENLTDGFVPAEEAWALAFPLPPDHADQLAKQLASVGLIKEVSNPEAPGWQVCAFLKRNASKEQVEALSEVRAESGRAGGKASRRPPKRAGQRRSQPNANQLAYQDASKLPPIVQSTENTDASNEASDGPAQAPAAPTVTQRSKPITDAYAEAQPMCRWPAVNGVVVHAIKAGKYTDDEILAALLRMAKGGQTVSVESLRIELEGFTPRASPNGRAAQRALPANISPRDEHRLRR